MAKCVGFLVLIISLQLVSFAFAVIPSASVENITHINEKGPYIGLISVYSLEENAFFSTGAFQPDAEYSSVDLSGRLYLLGTVHEKRVIYVKSGTGLVNAAAVTQQLLDLFNIRGIIHFGVAGLLDYESLSIGDVTIPTEFINAGIWDWVNPDGEMDKNDIIHLHFKDYNSPKEGDNLLGHLGYNPEEFYSNNTAQDLIWQPVDQQLLEFASNLQGIELQRCLETKCLKDKPKLVVGLRGSTANIFVDNSVYRKFLLRTLKVASADMESSAIVMTSLSNGSPVIVIRGISNLAGSTEKSAVFESLAAINTAIAVVEFLKELPADTVPTGMGLHGTWNNPMTS